MYVATRGLYKMKPPTIIVPASIKETVESLFEVHRKLDSSELKHNLVGLDIGGNSTSSIHCSQDLAFLLNLGHFFMQGRNLL